MERLKMQRRVLMEMLHCLCHFFSETLHELKMTPCLPLGLFSVTPGSSLETGTSQVIETCLRTAILSWKETEVEA